MDSTIPDLNGAEIYLPTKLHRIFNLNFTHGGRFYGAGHQQLSRNLRKLILIDNEPTVELDYSGMHLRMLYHMDGKEMSYKDPYSYAGGDGEIRNILKILALVLINNRGSDESTIRATQQSLQEDGINVPEGVCQHDLLTGLKNAHNQISHYFNTGIGLELQYRDSCIAERVMLAMAADGIKCLPVHDSFIVKSKHEGRLREAMITTYRSEMGGFRPVIKNS